MISYRIRRIRNLLDELMGARNISATKDTVRRKGTAYNGTKYVLPAYPKATSMAESSKSASKRRGSSSDESSSKLQKTAAGKSVRTSEQRAAIGKGKARAPDTPQTQAKKQKTRYSVSEALFLEWWARNHPEVGAVVYNRAPDKGPDFWSEFQPILEEYDRHMPNEVRNWRQIEKDNKWNAITPILKKYGWTIESMVRPKREGGRRYARWTATRSYQERNTSRN